MFDNSHSDLMDTVKRAKGNTAQAFFCFAKPLHFSLHLCSLRQGGVTHGGTNPLVVFGKEIGEKEKGTK